MVSLVYMVAGMSSRFGGRPKQMAKVGSNNETLIEYSVNQALKQKFKKIYFITNPKTEQLFRDIFKNKYHDIEVIYVEQKYDKVKRKKPWGTTDALCSLIGHIDNSFILLNGDDIYGESTFEIGYNMMVSKNINLVGGVPFLNSVPENGKVNRGIINVENGKVKDIKEVLDISRETHNDFFNKICNVNFIGLQVNILNMLNDILIKFKNDNKDDAKIECLLPDNLNELIQNNLMSMEYFEIKEKILGLTNPEDEEIVRNLLSKT